jgi:hypothetical protein
MYTPPSTQEVLSDLSAAQARVESDVTRFNTVYADYQTSDNKNSLRFSLFLPNYKQRQDSFLSKYGQPLIRKFIDRIMPNGGIVKVYQRVNVLHPGQHDHLHRYYFGSNGIGENKVYLLKFYDDETKWIVRENPEFTKVTCQNLTCSSLGFDQSNHFFGSYVRFENHSLPSSCTFQGADNIMRSYFTRFFEDPEWQFKNGNPLFRAEVTYDGKTVAPFDKLTLLQAMQETLGANLPPLMVNYMNRLGQAQTAKTLEDLRALELPTADFDRAALQLGMTKSL